MLSSYNRQVEAVRDLEQLLVFNTSGGHSLYRRQVKAVARAFEVCFSKYLNGVGHAPGGYVTVEERNLHASDSLLRARMTLHHLTDSWLLPIGCDPKNKIKACVHPEAHSSLTMFPDYTEPECTLRFHKSQCSSPQHFNLYQRNYG